MIEPRAIVDLNISTFLAYSTTSSSGCFQVSLIHTPKRRLDRGRIRESINNFFSPIATLWLCQNSYWKWPFIEFIVDFRINNGDFP